MNTPIFQEDPIKDALKDARGNPACECEGEERHTVEMDWYEYLQHTDRFVYIARADCPDVPKDVEIIFRNERFIVYKVAV